MKVCTKCNTPKDCFNKSSKNKDGLQNWCRDCLREYDRQRYANGDAGRKKTNWQNRVKRNREFVKDYLETHPCIDCGDTDWWALEFDHRDSATKEKDLSILIQQSTLEKVKAEIEKCDVRCVKCHRKRTIFQLNWWQIDFIRGLAQSG